MYLSSVFTVYQYIVLYRSYTILSLSYLITLYLSRAPHVPTGKTQLEWTFHSQRSDAVTKYMTARLRLLAFSEAM